MLNKYRVVRIDEYCHIVQKRVFFFFWAEMGFYANEDKGQWFVPRYTFLDSAINEIRRELKPHEKLGKIKVVNKKNYNRENLIILHSEY